MKSVLRRIYDAGRIYLEVVKRKFSRITSSNNEKNRQLIVCGYPRSGTTMFYNMLSSSLSEFIIDQWETSALESIWRYKSHASKHPIDVFNIDEIEKKNIHNKDLLVVVLIRDIRDIITSKHLFAPDSYLIGNEGAYTFSGEYPDYKKLFNGPGIEEYYKSINRLIDSNINLHLVRYEELVSDPDSEQGKLEREYGLKFEGKFSDYHLHKDRHKIKYEGKKASLDNDLVKSSKAVEKTKYIERWRSEDHRDRIIEQFKRYPQLFDMLIDYGYEDSKKWFDPYGSQV